MPLCALFCLPCPVDCVPRCKPRSPSVAFTPWYATGIAPLSFKCPSPRFQLQSAATFLPTSLFPLEPALVLAATPQGGGRRSSLCFFPSLPPSLPFSLRVVARTASAGGTEVRPCSTTPNPRPSFQYAPRVHDQGTAGTWHPRGHHAGKGAAGGVGPRPWPRWCKPWPWPWGRRRTLPCGGRHVQLVRGAHRTCRGSSSRVGGG